MLLRARSAIPFEAATNCIDVVGFVLCVDEIGDVADRIDRRAVRPVEWLSIFIEVLVGEFNCRWAV